MVSIGGDTSVTVDFPDGLSVAEQPVPASMPISIPAVGPAGTPTDPILTTGPLDVAPLTDPGGYGGVRRTGRPPVFAPNERRHHSRLPRRSGRPTVSVDNNRCRLYAICQMEAPASFLVARDGRLYYDAAPAPTEFTRVRQAARLCPTQAIALRAEPR